VIIQRKRTTAHKGEMIKQTVASVQKMVEDGVMTWVIGDLTLMESREAGCSTSQHPISRAMQKPSVGKCPKATFRGFGQKPTVPSRL